jgi:hypothetical protein
MQATTAQSLPNNRAAAIALLAAAIFTAGAALGAIAGTNLAPKVAPVAAIQASAPESNRSTPLRWHRYGEINVASVAEFGTTPTGPRYDVVRGK